MMEVILLAGVCGKGRDDSRKKDLGPRAGREFEEADLIFFRNAGGLRRFSIGSSTSAAFSSALMLHFVCITPDPTLGTYGCVWLSSDPVPRPASALGRRSGPVSESAFRVPSQRVRVPVRSKFQVTWPRLAVSESVGPSHGPPEAPSQLARVSVLSQPAEMVVLVGVLLFPPDVSALRPSGVRDYHKGAGPQGHC